MTQLPRGWHWASVDELAGGVRSNVVIGPFGSSLKVSDYTEGGVPLVFVRNIRARDFNFAGRARFVSHDKAQELRAHQVLPGDVLITKMGEPPGEAAVFAGQGAAVVTADCIRLRCGPGVDASFLAYAFESPSVQRQFEGITRGVAQRKVSLNRFRQSVVIPLPCLEEQRRIVSLLEDHLSRLDAAVTNLQAAERRANAMYRASLWHLTHGAHGDEFRLDELAEVRLGRQRSPSNHSGTSMRPYLRAGNVDWDRLRLDDIKQMNFTSAEEDTFRLAHNDILVVEASGSAGEVGKSALYRGEAGEVCFQNTLLRVRCHAVDPAFMQKYLLAEALNGRFLAGTRGVGIHHIGQARLASWPVRRPSQDVQRGTVQAAELLAASKEHLVAALTETKARSAALRRALLAAAFSGRLSHFVSSPVDTEHPLEMS